MSVAVAVGTGAPTHIWPLCISVKVNGVIANVRETFPQRPPGLVFELSTLLGKEGWPMLSVGSGGCLTTTQVGRANNEFNWTKATATTPIGGQPCSSTNLTPNFFATKLLGYFGHIPPAITLINASFPKLFLISQYISKIPTRFKLNQVSLGRLIPA